MKVFLCAVLPSSGSDPDCIPDTESELTIQITILVVAVPLVEVRSLPSALIVQITLPSHELGSVDRLLLFVVRYLPPIGMYVLLFSSVQ